MPSETIINSAEDVRRVLPKKAKIGLNGIFCNGNGLYIDLDQDGDGILDGVFTPDEILALAYWINHRNEFPEAS